MTMFAAGITAVVFATKLEPPTLATAGKLVAVCSSELDCGLNGDCIGGACACDAAWRGATCTELNLVPLAPDAVESGAYRHGSSTSVSACAGVGLLVSTELT